MIEGNVYLMPVQRSERLRPMMFPRPHMIRGSKVDLERSLPASDAQPQTLEVRGIEGVPPSHEGQRHLNETTSVFEADLAGNSQAGLPCRRLVPSPHRGLAAHDPVGEGLPAVPQSATGRILEGIKPEVLLFHVGIIASRCEFVHILSMCSTQLPSAHERCLVLDYSPAGVTQLVEFQPSKLAVAGSSPVSRSIFSVLCGEMALLADD